MEALPYEINEYIIRYIVEDVDIKKLKEIIFTSKYFYNIMMSYIKQRYNLNRIHDFIIMKYNVCIKCYSTNYTSTFNMNYCKNCVKTLKMITLTDAKKMYFLNDVDLDYLFYIEKRNPHRRSMSMFLFLEEQVESLAIKKHTSDGLLELHNKRNNRKDRRTELESEKNTRKQEIIDFFKNEYTIYQIQRLFTRDTVEKYIKKNIPKLEKRKNELFEYMKNSLEQMKTYEEFLKVQKEEESKNKAIKLDIKTKHDRHAKCCELSCNNIGSIKCISKKCKTCCNGVNCERHTHS